MNEARNEVPSDRPHISLFWGAVKIYLGARWFLFVLVLGVVCGGLLYSEMRRVSHDVRGLLGYRSSCVDQ